MIYSLGGYVADRHTSQFDTAVQTCQLDGEKLYKDFADLLSDVDKYRQKLTSISEGLA